MTGCHYQLGHVPGAVLFDWRRTSTTPRKRHLIKQQLEELFTKSESPRYYDRPLRRFQQLVRSLRLLDYNLRRQKRRTDERWTEKWIDETTIDQRHLHVPKTSFKASGPTRALESISSKPRPLPEAQRETGRRQGTERVHR